MFTGIIEAVAKVAGRRESQGGLEITVVKPRGWKLRKGDSVNINGVCSTVKKQGADLEFFYMPETVSKSNVAGLAKGSVVNLERPLTVSSRLDGHIVQGHVDTVGTLRRIKKAGQSFVVEIALPANSKKLMRYIAPKGSVAVEGISLTVVDVLPQSFTVSLIPYTWEATNFHAKTVGSVFNIEFDALAKYLERLILFQK